MVSDQGVHLSASTTVPFSVATGSILRLQQLLAELGYLPLSFTPTAPMTSPTQEADVQQGTFGWRWPDQPASLTSLWTLGEMNIITKGAVMDFEDQHDLKTDGAPGAQVWTDLLADATSGHADANPYRYVYVTEDDPETVTVYQDGVVDYRTLANTGVPGAATQQGTFTVFARYLTTTMTGTNVDGTTYSDPGIPWVSYFNGGDALHGYDRGGYGYPQSNGCVEMPPANAAIVYPLTPIGTLVTVG
jgi:lipoprotein-anchoring transpeptidase ErfK/SrfK